MGGAQRAPVYSDKICAGRPGGAPSAAAGGLPAQTGTSGPVRILRSKTVRIFPSPLSEDFCITASLTAAG